MLQLHTLICILPVLAGVLAAPVEPGAGIIARAQTWVKKDEITDGWGKRHAIDGRGWGKEGDVTPQGWGKRDEVDPQGWGKRDEDSPAGWGRNKVEPEGWGRRDEDYPAGWGRADVEPAGWGRRESTVALPQEKRQIIWNEVPDSNTGEVTDGWGKREDNVELGRDVLEEIREQARSTEQDKRQIDPHANLVDADVAIQGWGRRAEVRVGGSIVNPDGWARRDDDATDGWGRRTSVPALNGRDEEAEIVNIFAPYVE